MSRHIKSGDVRKRLSWMVPADEAILRLMAAAEDELGDPLHLSPIVISWNIGYSRQHTGNRVRELVDRGLLIKVDDGRYVISELGEDVVTGNADFEKLDE